MFNFYLKTKNDSSKHSEEIPEDMIDSKTEVLWNSDQENLSEENILVDGDDGTPAQVHKYLPSPSYMEEEGRSPSNETFGSQV